MSKNIRKMKLDFWGWTEENGRVTVGELIVFTQFNRHTLRKHLESLVKTNQIQQNGIGKGTWYTLS